MSKMEFEFEFLFQPGLKFTFVFEFEFDFDFEFKSEFAFEVALGLESELPSSSSIHLPAFLSSVNETTATYEKALAELNFHINLVRKLPSQDPKWVSK